MTINKSTIVNFTVNEVIEGIQDKTIIVGDREIKVGKLMSEGITNKSINMNRVGSISEDELLDAILEEGEYDECL